MIAPGVHRRKEGQPLARTQVPTARPKEHEQSHQSTAGRKKEITERRNQRDWKQKNSTEKSVTQRLGPLKISVKLTTDKEKERKQEVQLQERPQRTIWGFLGTTLLT